MGLVVGVRRVLQILRGRGEETDAGLRRSEARREVQRPRGLGGTLQRRALCDVVRMELVGRMLGDVRIGGQGEVEGVFGTHERRRRAVRGSGGPEDGVPD